MNAKNKLPRKGDRVRIVESLKTSNWSRINLGRTAVVQGMHNHQWRNEPGPRVHVLLQYEERQKHDAKHNLPAHYALCEVENIDIH